MSLITFQDYTNADLLPMPPNGLPNGSATSPAIVPLAPIIYEASSISEIRAALNKLHAQDAHITAQLQALLNSQADLSRDLGRLDLLRAHLGTQVLATRAINNGMLETAAVTASSLSSKVRALDLEKSRVQATLAVVEQVAELKACVQGVVGSMGAPQDWEAAAGYVARAGRIPEHIVQGGFAARVVPSVEVPEAPGVTLENAKESLCGLFLREFEKAAADGDGSRVTRFFKLFPLIGRADAGLDVYGRYVCQGVASTARANLKTGTGGKGGMEGFFYANALTKLFEHIAQIVEGHGGLVERHYGVGKMVKVVERLQAEADVQGGIILDTWSDERNVDRRLTDVKSYPFSFLVQSFLPVHRSAMGTPRANSPAIIEGSHRRTSEDEGVDMKEIDGMLSESAVMLGRWSLYSKFLASKCKDPDTPSDAPLIVPDFMIKSALSRKISARLITPFNIMSTFFFRRSVEKAFQLDESPSGLYLNLSKPLDGTPPYIISAVDDVMYIVNTVLQRSISTSQRDIISSVIPTVGRVLGSDFIGMIQRKMRDESYPKPAISGGFPPEDKIIAFIVLINSLDVSNDYIGRIVTSRLSKPSSVPNGTTSHDHTTLSPALTELFPFDHDVTFVTSTLTALQTSFSSKATELTTDGITVLFNQVIKPRLRPIFSDTFRDTDYSDASSFPADQAPEDADISEPENPDAVAQRFEHAWDALMKPLARLMAGRTFASALEMTARYLAGVLEKRIWGFAGGKASALGAVRMERDFAGIVGVVCRGGSYGLREVFSRVMQVLMVLNMEEDEWEEVIKGEGETEEDGIHWVISVEERGRARGIVKN